MAVFYAQLITTKEINNGRNGRRETGIIKGSLNLNIKKKKFKENYKILHPVHPLNLVVLVVYLVVKKKVNLNH